MLIWTQIWVMHKTLSKISWNAFQEIHPKPPVFYANSAKVPFLHSTFWIFCYQSTTQFFVWMSFKWQSNIVNNGYCGFFQIKKLGQRSKWLTIELECYGYLCAKLHECTFGPWSWRVTGFGQYFQCLIVAWCSLCLFVCPISSLECLYYTVPYKKWLRIHHYTLSPTTFGAPICLSSSPHNQKLEK